MYQPWEADGALVLSLSGWAEACVRGRRVRTGRCARVWGSACERGTARIYIWRLSVEHAMGPDVL